MAIHREIKWKSKEQVYRTTFAKLLCTHKLCQHMQSALTMLNSRALISRIMAMSTSKVLQQWISGLLMLQASLLKTRTCKLWIHSSHICMSVQCFSIWNNTGKKTDKIWNLRRTMAMRITSTVTILYSLLIYEPRCSTYVECIMSFQLFGNGAITHDALPVNRTPIMYSIGAMDGGTYTWKTIGTHSSHGTPCNSMYFCYTKLGCTQIFVHFMPSFHCIHTITHKEHGSQL